MSNKIIQFIDGPNLNMLGQREPEIYGTMTLDDIHKSVLEYIQKNSLKLEAKFFHSNTEGEIVNCIQNSSKTCDGIIINAGGLSHTSIAILDTLLAVKIPKIEVHISNLFKREEFRHHSYISKGVNGLICGFGADGYLLAVDGINKLL